MNRITLFRNWSLAAVSTLCLFFSVGAQSTVAVEPPYNPDSNEDGVIGSSDLMGLLAVFGYDFVPESIFIDGMTLEEYLIELTAWVAELEGQIASAGNFGVTNVEVNPDNTLVFTFSDGTTLNTPLLVGPAGPEGAEGASAYDIWLALGNEGSEAEFIESLQAPEPANPFPDPSTIPDGSLLFWNGEEWVSVQAAGCMDAYALNYDGSSLFDDGSCVDACDNESAINYQGYEYGLVAIAGLCWFQENLQSEAYSNGDAIATGLSTEEWVATSEGAIAAYANDPGLAQLYGYLYNWPAVQDTRGICPSGWRVSTAEDWSNVVNTFGGPYNSVAGEAMKASPWDPIPWDGMNSSGFSGLPGGGRSNDGEDVQLGAVGVWYMAMGEANAQYAVMNTSDQGVTYSSNCTGCGLSIRCVKNCEDSDGDGVCNGDEVPGCTDAAALNYQGGATDDDGSCMYPVPFECGDAVTYFGREYATVAIGSQCWFAENLATPIYSNGEVISGGLSDAAWSSTSSGAQAVYANDAAYLATYGRLYNWYAVDDARGVCPSGWHVPTDGEWTVLELELGMSVVDANDSGWRGTDQGAQLKSSDSDSPGWDGNNSSGFAAFPGGGRNSEGLYDSMGTWAFFWSATPEGPNSWNRILNSGNDGVYRLYDPLQVGLSVRCLQDCEDADGDGICNSDEVAGCTDATAENYNAAATDDDGSCTYPAFACGDGVTYQGHNYSTVAIGDQCWFAENLRSDAYANGDAIPGELTDGEWSSTTAGAQAVSDNDAANLITYGRLYNWYAVDDERGLCPSGWHVPTDEEYMTLEMELGMSSSEVDSTGWRGTDQGAQMKASAYDSPSWEGTNSSGFSALPVGYRYSNGSFNAVGYNAYFWSSPHVGYNSWSRLLYFGNDAVYRSLNDQRYGFSVRCIED